MQECKFTMELVWHNCLNCKPSEEFNPRLFVTDGVRLYEVAYKSGVGFAGPGIFIDDSDAEAYWWADIIQTISYT